MGIHSRIMAGAFLALAAIAPRAHAQGPDRIVSVQADNRNGQGITRRRGDECFVISPDHVVQGPRDSARRAPDTIWVRASRGERIPTSFVKEFPRDMALLHVHPESPYAATLCAEWPEVLSLERIMSRPSGETVIKGRDEQGNGDGMPVALTGDDATDEMFKVRPTLTGDRIERGMSGSLVYVNGRAAGILLWEMGNGTVGIVQRLDRVEPDLAPFLREHFPPSRALIRTSLLFPGRGQLATRRGEIGVVWFAATLAASTYLFTRSEVVDRTEVFEDDFGIPRSYPYQEREFPLQWYAAATWVASGVLSTWEAGRFARRGYDRGKPAATPRTSLRMGVYPAMVAGERAVVVGAGFSF